MKIIKNLFVSSLCVLWMLPVTASANYAERDDVKSFISEMVKKHQFDRKVLEQWFSKAEKPL